MLHKFLFCLSLLSFLVRGQIRSFVDLNDFSDYTKKAIEILGSPNNLKDTYYASKILDLAKDKPKKFDCKQVLNLLSNVSDNFDLFYGISTSSRYGCDFEASVNTKNNLKSELKSTNIKVLAGAALAAKALDVKYSGMNDVLGKLKSLMEPDGTFRDSLDSKISSVENAGIALQVVAAYADESSKFIVSEIIETTQKLLPQGDDENSVDPVLLADLAKLSKDKIRINPQQLQVIADSLLSLRFSDDIATVAGSLEALQVISSYKAQPIFVKLHNDEIKMQDKKILQLSAFTVLGNSVDIVDISVKSIKPAGKKESLSFAGQVVTKDKEASIDLSDMSLEAGVYVITFVTTLATRKATVTSEKSFTILSRIDISSVAFGVSESRQTPLAEMTVVKSQGSLHSYTAIALSSEYLHVTFTLLPSQRDLTPHQIFIKYTHLDTNTDTFFLGQEDGTDYENAGIKYHSVVSLGDNVDAFLSLSGTYSITILVGDASISNSFEWNLGNVDLTFPAKVVKTYPLYIKSLLAESDNSLAALPEITHRMRSPAKRASLFTSTLFTALTAIPLIVLLGFMIRLQPNLNRMRSVTGILFAVIVFLVLYLYGAYWCGVKGASFYETIKYLCFLAPLTAILGRSALATITYYRLGENKKE